MVSKATSKPPAMFKADIVFWSHSNAACFRKITNA
jgi:hypothetical protein